MAASDYIFEEPIDAKRTYKYEKDHSHDVSYENERKHDNVHSPSHYMHGKKETIDVIRDCMESDEYHGYLKGNVLKYHLKVEDIKKIWTTLMKHYLYLIKD